MGSKARMMEASWAIDAPAQKIFAFLARHAGPSPKYFGYKRGITLLNAVNDQVMGIRQMVVPGTPRDSLYILDCLIGPSRRSSRPTRHPTRTWCSGSSPCSATGSRPASPIWATSGSGGPTSPAATPSDYGPLEAIARNKINRKKIHTQWSDMFESPGRW